MIYKKIMAMLYIMASIIIFFSCDTGLMDINQIEAKRILPLSENIPSSLKKSRGLLYVILKSSAMKDEYIEQVKIEYFKKSYSIQEEWESDYKPEIDEMFSVYDETFFITHNLLIFPGFNESYIVKKINVKNNELYIKIQVVDNPFVEQAMGEMNFCTIFIFKKIDFNGDKVIIDKYTTWW